MDNAFAAKYLRVLGSDMNYIVLPTVFGRTSSGVFLLGLIYLALFLLQIGPQVEFPFPLLMKWCSVGLCAGQVDSRNDVYQV